MAQAAPPVPANTPLGQVLQPIPTSPQISTYLVQRGTGTASNHEATATTITVLSATQYTQAVRQHHLQTIRLIFSRRRFSVYDNPRRLLALDDRIRTNADLVCDNVERALMHGVRIS